MEEIKIGKYLHFKGKEYEVIGIARHSETLEELVLYKNLYNHPIWGFGAIWARPKQMFLETVEKDGKKVKRFKYIGK